MKASKNNEKEEELCDVGLQPSHSRWRAHFKGVFVGDGRTTADGLRYAGPMEDARLGSLSMGRRAGGSK